MKIEVPFGRSSQTAIIPDRHSVVLVDPVKVPGAKDVNAVVTGALDVLLGDVNWKDFRGVSSVAIAINDNTRPVPHVHLLPPLMDHLAELGITDRQITFYIAGGTHEPMSKNEFPDVLPSEIISRYRVVAHTASNIESLTSLGKSTAGTEILINSSFYNSGLKIVVGNIEPHQFAGFSGGVKTAAIGLAGMDTINHNHSLLRNPFAQLGEYDRNPLRQDIEAIGKQVGVHLALNAILNHEKAIVHVLAGDPVAVMQAGVKLSRQVCQVKVPEIFDLVVSSPGGHPKDINLYQAQKGLAHAAMITKTGGTIILVAACPEGSGSRHYEEWMQGKRSHTQVIKSFFSSEFRVGPHKGYLIARDAERCRLLFCSEMETELAKSLLLNPVGDLQSALDLALRGIDKPVQIGVMMHASTTIPDVIR